MTSLRLACTALIAVAIVACSAALAGGPPSPAARPAPPSAYDALPPETQGACPVEMPKYDGVDQLLVLSNRWVIVAVVDIDEVIAKADELSGGELLKAAAAWDKTKDTAHPDWSAQHAKDRLRDQFIAQARELCDERKMDSADFYRITSNDDTTYSPAERPLRVTRCMVSLGGQVVAGSHEIHYAQYCYLELPQPMQTGRTYTIALQNGKKVTFAFDEMRTVSRAIKVNQVGYLSDAGRKYAYLGAYLQEFGPLDFSFAREFQVVSAETGKVVFTGPVKLREKNPRFTVAPGKCDDPNKRPPMFGEDVYELDFSALKDEGEFFIRVPGVGRSWTFRHAHDAYGQAFYTACRGLYHQRCGIPLERKYTAWTRIRCHTEPIYESENVPFGIGDFNAPKGYNTFEVNGATIDTSRKTENVRGGWHDAADWDRGIMHYADIFDLLTAYELAPRKFTDGQLDIPESGNGIPDILDEAEYGLMVWKRSQDERGGVAGVVETNMHPSIDDPEAHWSFSRRTRWTSLVYAAAAAQYALLVKPFDAAKSAEFAESARKAYDFGADPASSLGKITIHAAKNHGHGEKYTLDWEEPADAVTPYLIQAKLRMYMLTQEAKYLDGVQDMAEKAPRPYEYPFSYRDFSPWFYYAIVKGAQDKLPAELVGNFRAVYLKAADELLANIEAEPYRMSWPRTRDYWIGWGAGCTTNFGRALLAAYGISGDKKYRDAAALNADFMLGANPMGICWTTGLGFTYPVNIQHENSQYDSILDPVPGLTIYGVDGGPIYSAFRRNVWSSPTSDGKGKIDFIKPENANPPFFRRWGAHPYLNVGQCEFTIHETMASTIFTCAMLMDEGWMPSRELKDRNPRKDELLFGYWYLP